MGLLAKKYTISPPLDATQARNIDECLDDLYRNINISIIGGSAAQPASTYNEGDVIYFHSSILTGLAISPTAGAVIRSTGTDPQWSTTSWPNAATTGQIVYASGTNAYGNLAPGTSGLPLVSAGAGAAPTYTTLTSSGGGIGPITPTLGGVLVGQDTSNWFVRAASTQNTIFQMGASYPAWSTAAYPPSSAQGDLIYSSVINGFATLAKNTTATRYLANTAALNNPQWDLVNLANGTTGTLPVGAGGTGAGAFTPGSVIFAGASGVYSQDNANLFWDVTNHRLGVGTNVPGFLLDVAGGTFRIQATGNFRCDVFNPIGFLSSGVGFNILNIANSLAGTGNGAQLVIGTDVINNFIIYGLSSTYTASGPFQPNGGVLANSGASGLAFLQSGTGDITFWTTGALVKRLTIKTGGGVVTTNVLWANNAIIGALGVGSTGTGDRTGLVVQTAGLDAYWQVFYDGTTFANSATYITSEGYKPISWWTHDAERMRLSTTGGLFLGGTADPGQGNFALSGLIPTYKNIATTGWGVPAIYGYARPAAGQTAAVTFATYTVGATDGSFLISANVNVTVSTLHNFTVTCTYTNESNVGQVYTFGFNQLIGTTTISAITNVTGVNSYESPVTHIRCKASTSITIASTGTFTTVTYNGEGSITQIA